VDREFQSPAQAYVYGEELEQKGFSVSVYFDSSFRIWVVEVNPKIGT